MVGRLPESWIPPEHILDLRTRVGLRHSLVTQRGESQQRIQASPRFAQRRNPMTDASRPWLAAQALPATAREQITVGVAMIEALDLQLAPIDKQLRA